MSWMNLVVQGPALERNEADAAASMTNAAEVVPLARRAFRLKNASAHESIAAWCATTPAR